MICRLCLSNLSPEIAVPIFTKTDEIVDKDVSELIAKYMQLKLLSGDPVSTTICQECYEHLTNFHRFWIHIEQKQRTLQNQQPYEFFEVKCDDSDYFELSQYDNTVDATSNQELLELKVDPVSNDNNGSLLTEVKHDISSDELWPAKDAKKKFKDILSTSRSKAKETNKIQQKQRKAVDVKDEILSSEETVSDNLVLSCELCKERVENFEELCKHFEMQHNEQKAFIKCCGKKFTQNQTVTNHIKRHRLSIKYICPICDKALCSENNLTIHMNSKHNERKSNCFKCHICQKEFQSKRYCESHILRHDSEKKKIDCDKCERSFSSIMRLKRHCEIMHKAVYPYKCQACEENFLSKKDMETHHTFCKNRAVLKEGQKVRKNVPTELICQICCKIFANSYRLSKHVAFVHENVHPYVCEQCGRKFKFKPTFEKHLLQHAGVVDPPAQCKVCCKWLKNKNSLRLHLYAHDNANNKCELCNHTSPTRTALKHHVKVVHRLEREYECKYCDKSFKDSKSQEEHIATHTGAQLYSCPHCAKETRSSSNMYAHVKRMHPEDWLKAKLARSHDPNTKKNLKMLKF